MKHSTYDNCHYSDQCKCEECEEVRAIASIDIDMLGPITDPEDKLKFEQVYGSQVNALRSTMNKQEVR